MAHAFNPSTWEAEAGGFLSSRPAWTTEWVPGQPGLHRETLSRKTKQNKKKAFYPKNKKPSSSSSSNSNSSNTTASGSSQNDDDEDDDDNVAPSAHGYIFPVQGCSRANINKLVYPSYRGHTGIDVNRNVVGKNVVAVKAGTVVKSEAKKNSNGTYRSYGEYVVINHHDGTMTLYAHMLAGTRKVSKGQEVSQGQVLGTVGSTGNSTGTHLHFEVLIGGSPVNPIPYLP